MWPVQPWLIAWLQNIQMFWAFYISSNRKKMVRSLTNSLFNPGLVFSIPTSKSKIGLKTSDFFKQVTQRSSIKKCSIALMSLFYIQFSYGQGAEACESWPSWFKPTCTHITQIFIDGQPEIYATGYAWHNRAKYDDHLIKKYNENSWGGGIGKGYENANGDWEGLYLITFLDSHSDVEPMAGYQFLKILHLGELKIGGGFTVFFTAREGYFDGYPFPGALPWAAITYKQFSIVASYVPGGHNYGNVLFLAGKWTV